MRFEEYIGKKVTINLDDYDNVEFDWWGEYTEDGLNIGEGHINLDYRPYNDSEEDEEEDDDDEYFDETRNWDLETGLDFTVDDSGCISIIEITARVYCAGDSGLGDINPDEYWDFKDDDLAEDFLREITKEQ